MWIKFYEAHTGIYQNEGNTNIKCLKRVLSHHKLPEQLQSTFANILTSGPKPCQENAPHTITCTLYSCLLSVSFILAVTGMPTVRKTAVWAACAP